MAIISYQTIPFPPADGFVAAVTAAGQHISSGPDGWHVDDAATAQAIFNSFAGSAAQLAHAKANANGTGKFNQLAAIYFGKFAAGFNYTGPDGVKRTFQIDAQSQFNIDVQANASLGAIINSVALVTQPGSGLEAETWDANSYFIAADNSHMATPLARDMRAFALATRGYVSALILNNRALKDRIAAATDMATLNAIDITAGWPANP